jgi:AcrR family transcriptional regulator
MRAMEPARTRREEYAEATYEALLESAAECFLESGWAATSLDAVAKRARVTKGAIYHHFNSKRDLFLAVMERQEEINARTIDEAATTAADPWGAIVAAFDAFLRTIADPVYQRLCFVEGPAALGFEDWWAWGERTEIDLIRRQLDRVAEAGLLLVEDIDMLAHVLFGAVTAGVLAMARTEDPEGERERFRTVMLQLVHGLVQVEAFKPPWDDGAA